MVKPTFETYYAAMWNYFRVRRKPSGLEDKSESEWKEVCLWPAYQMLCDAMRSEKDALVNRVLDGFCAFIHPVHLVDACNSLHKTVDRPANANTVAEKIWSSRVVPRCSQLAGELELRVADRLMHGGGDRQKKLCLETIGQCIENKLRYCTIAAVGRYHTAFLDGNGGLYAYGNNEYGQLGHPPETLPQSDESVAVVHMHNNPGNDDKEEEEDDKQRTRTQRMPMAKTVSCGPERTAVVLRDGGLVIFGLNAGTRHPSKADFDDKVVRCSSVSCGRRHTVVIADDDTVYGCGDNEFGQLGSADRFYGHFVLIDLPEALQRRRAVSVSCGNEHTAVLLDDGVLLMTGHNKFGQLGVDKDTISRSRELRQLDRDWGWERYACVSCGGEFTAAVSRTGRLCTFGRNNNGQCGRAVETDFLVPGWVDVFVGQPIAKLACGEEHVACVRARDGELFTFGKADDGQLGHADRQEDPAAVMSPRQVMHGFGGNEVEQLSCGACSTVVVTNHGDIWQTGSCDTNPANSPWTFQLKMFHNVAHRTLALKVIEKNMWITFPVRTMLQQDAFDEQVREMTAPVASIVTPPASLRVAADGGGGAGTLRLRLRW